MVETGLNLTKVDVFLIYLIGQNNDLRTFIFRRTINYSAQRDTLQRLCVKAIFVTRNYLYV